MSLEPKSEFDQVRYPSWFLDTEQDYIANIIAQAYDLSPDHASE